MGVRVLEVVCDQGKLRSQLSCCVEVCDGIPVLYCGRELLQLISDGGG